MSGVTVLGLLLVSICTASAIECYSCGDVNFGPCYDPKILETPSSVCTSNSSSTPTNGTAEDGFLCYTVHLTFSVEVKVVERGCVHQESTENFCRRWSILGDGIHEVNSCELCDTDLCNSGAFGLRVSHYVFLLLCLLGSPLIS